MAGIRAKLLGYTALIILLVSALLTSYSIVAHRNQMLEIYREDALQIGKALSEAVLNDLYRLDMRGLRLRLSAVHQNKTVTATFILDKKGHIMADGTNENNRRGQPLADPFVARILLAKAWVIHVDTQFFTIGRPIVLGEEPPMGWLYLQLSLEYLNQRIDQQFKENLIISGLCVLLGLISALIFSARFTRPIRTLTQTANLIRSGDTTLEIPVTGQDEIRHLSISLGQMMQQLRDSEKALRELNVSLDFRVQERTLELGKALKLVDDSIHYASNIQRSILPTAEFFKILLPQHFLVWQPRDTVGGDIYWCRFWGGGTLIIVGDCTGHGVPGAFMTLIANGALGHAMRTTRPGELNTLVATMHSNIQDTLGQDVASGASDDGLELGACYIHAERQNLVFVGARFSLFHQKYGALVAECKGDRKGLGYRGLPRNMLFTEHVLDLYPNQRFILTTDGIIDQLGEKKRHGFGKKRFLAVLNDHKDTPIQEIGTHLCAALLAYQGDQIRRDDVTIVGFTALNPGE